MHSCHVAGEKQHHRLRGDGNCMVHQSRALNALQADRRRSNVSTTFESLTVAHDRFQGGPFGDATTGGCQQRQQHAELGKRHKDSFLFCDSKQDRLPSGAAQHRRMQREVHQQMI